MRRTVSTRFAWAIYALLVVAFAVYGVEVGSFTSPLRPELGGTGQEGYTRGNLIYATGPRALAKLPIGTSGQFLATDGVAPLWTDRPTGGGGSSHEILSATHTDSTVASVVRGDVITGQGATPTWSRLAIGSSGKVLHSDGTDPSWQALVSGDIPNLAASKITSGQLAAARGGTGIDASGATDGQLLIGQTSDNSLGLATLTGTSNQVTVTNAGHSVTLSTPQSIGTGSSPTFAGLTLSSPLTEGNGGTHQSTYTTGDLLYASAANTLSKLAIGTSTYILTVSGGIPSWAAASTATSHNMLSTTHADSTAGSVSRGDIITGQAASPTWKRLALGNAGTVLQSDGTDAGYAVPFDFVNGLGIAYTAAGQVTVATGKIPDSTQGRILSLTTATVCDFATTAAINGTDQFTATPTMSTTNASANATASASVYTASYVPIAHATIAFSTTTTAMTASADVRGWLSVGDMAGNSANGGFSRVTAINNTGLTVTLTAALPGGNQTTKALQKIENPAQKIAADTAATLNTIATDGVTIVLSANAQATASGRALVVGGETVSRWYAVWITLESGTTGLRFSTQRTTPFSANTAFRRLGWAYNDSSGNITAFLQTQEGLLRWYEWTGYTDANAYVLNNQSPTANAWNTVSCATFAPPTATRLRWTSEGDPAGGATGYYFRSAGYGITNTARPSYYSVANGSIGTGHFDLPCDLAQQFDYTVTAANSHTYATVRGFVDDLTR